MSTTERPERRSRRKFTDQFRRDAVRMVLLEGIPIKKAAEKLGIDRSCLNRWKNEHLEQQGGLKTARHGHSGGDPCAMTPKEMDVEMRKLRKQLREAELQREILKKALSIFSREPGNGINS